MFIAQLSSLDINIIIAIICSLIVGIVFIKMSFAYTKKRAKKRYAINRQAAPSISVFRNLSKLLFVSSMLMTLASYWMSYWVSPVFILKIPFGPYVQLFGASLVLYGYIRLQGAFLSLGNNYSPLFEAYLPNELITQGAYQLIRHPIYLFNLFVSFGLAISSTSLLVGLNALMGLVFILKAIKLEEAYLTDAFPAYDNYSKNSWRLIPGVF